MYHQDLYICAYCLADPGLAEFIRNNAIEEPCSFCKSTVKAAKAALVDDVSDHFIKCLFQEYDLAVNQLGWESREGGWMGTFWDADELVQDEIELDFPNDNMDALLPHLFGEYFDQDWCERDAYGLNDTLVASYSWEHFCDVVMHERRFFFMDVKGDPFAAEVYSPKQVLQTIFEYARKVGLLIKIPAGTQMFRARMECVNRQLTTAEDMGPPPSRAAKQANRMSPAGIPMFYACDDEQTALKEITARQGSFAIGRFETLRETALLDLTAIPPIPSLFDMAPENVVVPKRRMLRFLHHVAREMARPIERDDRIHVEYVPTQIVTEFLRYQIAWDHSPVDGIKYYSSVHDGHASYVLFADQSNILDTPESVHGGDVWLKLNQITHSSEDE